MFESFSRSWAYAKTSYEILWEHKRLVVFPILAGIAAIVVTASFLIPLYGSGALEHWMESTEDTGQEASRVGMYVTAFLFYLCHYFVIVFFNTALIGSTLMWMNGQTPTLAGGLSLAVKRLPQIFGWALLSAIIGTLLRIVENSHKKAGRIVVAILGSAWTAMTFFVVPVIAVDGVGPIEAFKRSLKTLRSTWGTALIGNFFSLVILGLLFTLPILLVGVLLMYAGFNVGPIPLKILLFGLSVGLIAIAIAIPSAADTIFKALLFCYTTDRTIPAGIDTSQFDEAFAPSGE